MPSTSVRLVLAGAVISPMRRIDPNVSGPPCQRTTVAIAAYPTTSAATTATTATSQLAGLRMSISAIRSCWTPSRTTVSANNTERFIVSLRTGCRSRSVRYNSSPTSRPTIKPTGVAKNTPSTRTISPNVNV